MDIEFCSHDGCSEFANSGAFCRKHTTNSKAARRYNNLGQKTRGIAVVCVTTGDRFGSIIEAAGAYGACAGVVRRSCDTGLPLKKMGLRFRFAMGKDPR